ncbi:hypothetical protein AAEO50_12280 [Rossellomorea oryzaecorticis]|uniref:DUF3127 domain-containing protein n=1 Tax=Rossellomorea oryzaecorticis TaxID=1396505 RepID=A0ABU9KD02_9BACI
MKQIELIGEVKEAIAEKNGYKTFTVSVPYTGTLICQTETGLVNADQIEVGKKLFMKCTLKGVVNNGYSHNYVIVQELVTIDE